MLRSGRRAGRASGPTTISPPSAGRTDLAAPGQGCGLPPIQPTLIAAPVPGMTTGPLALGRQSFSLSGLLRSAPCGPVPAAYRWMGSSLARERLATHERRTANPPRTGPGCHATRRRSRSSSVCRPRHAEERAPVRVRRGSGVGAPRGATGVLEVPWRSRCGAARQRRRSSEGAIQPTRRRRCPGGVLRRTARCGGPRRPGRRGRARSSTGRRRSWEGGTAARWPSRGSTSGVGHGCSWPGSACTSGPRDVVRRWAEQATRSSPRARGSPGDAGCPVGRRRAHR